MFYISGNSADRVTNVADVWVLDLDGGTSWRAVAGHPNPKDHFSTVVLTGDSPGRSNQRRREQAGHDDGRDRHQRASVVDLGGDDLIGFLRTTSRWRPAQRSRPHRSEGCSPHGAPEMPPSRRPDTV